MSDQSPSLQSSPEVSADSSLSPLRLFDTMSRSLRELRPLDGRTFRFYCCGPTVYGPAHIGNFRTFVLQDVMRRVLELSGTPTFHVRNLTDVDDKTIAESQAQGQSLTQFTTHWTEKFHQDCTALNLLKPHVEPSAVAHIEQQIAMIETLLERNHAYVSKDGSVYFSIQSYPEYGALSRLDKRELDLGHTQQERGHAADEYDKDSVADFVLWKARREEDGENYWSSPWGEGRPGWHLECSAMSREYLGDDFDLHGGGEDLIFPHHENEIAQSRCATEGQFAAHWFHSRHLLVEGAKMSKSLGNLYTLADLEQMGHSAASVRYELISGHFRKQLNFTLASLDDAALALDKIAQTVSMLAEAAGTEATEAPMPSYQELQAQTGTEEELYGIFLPAWQALWDDLNTPAALGQMFTAFKQLKQNPLNAEAATLALRQLQRFLAALGLPSQAVPPPKQETAPEHIQQLAAARQEARASKDWAKADALRDELATQGWQVIDEAQGYHLEQI